MMRSEVIVANCKDLQNSECDKYNNFDKIPVLIKEEIDDDRENIVFDEYGDVTFTESKVKIEENILDAFEAMPVLEESALSDIEEKANQKVSEIHYNHRENVLIRESFKSQDLISSNPETIHVKYERTLQSPSDVIVNEKSNEDEIEDKTHIDTLTNIEGICSQENAEKINQDMCLNMNKERNISNISSSELNNVDDNVPSNHKNKPHAKDKAKQSSYHKSNGKVIEFDGRVQSVPVGYNIEKDFVLSVIVERKAICEEKIYQMMLDTKEKLFVSLRQEDLCKLQEQHNEDHSKTEENGRVKWHQWSSNRAKRFWCRFCPFTANDKCTLVIHIIENHRKLVPNRKFAPPECMTPGKDPSVIWYKCLECAYVTNNVHVFLPHFFRHKPHELETLRCAQCSFQTKYKHHLVRHFDMHKAIYHKCIHCDFRTKYPKYMKVHIRMLHNTDELELLKCKKCSFQTKYKKSLKSHVLTHNEVRKMYKCALCPFETPSIDVLRNSHKIRHKSEEEARIHKCEFCSYKAKTKNDLRRHEDGHKSIDELKMYKCGICLYQTRHKYYLNTHRSTHQAADEDNMHPCDFCSYQGKTRRLMLAHRRSHKESKIYKCEECPYQSRNSHNLKRHRLKHKSANELTLFYCDKCSYRGKNKDRLRTHCNNVHKHPEDIKWQKCNVCDFKTKQLGNLKRHMLVHMDPSEANKFKCDRCSYRTKNKHDIKAHAVKHSNKYLNCDQCDFKSKYRSTMTRHQKHRHS